LARNADCKTADAICYADDGNAIPNQVEDRRKERCHEAPMHVD